MPLKKCSVGKQSGWKFGDKGRCYIGPGAKQKAIKQGYAENGGDEKKFKEEMGKAGLLEDHDVQSFLEGIQPTGAARFLSAIADHCEAKKLGAATAAQADFAVAYVTAEERQKIPAENFADRKRRRFPINSQAHLNAAAKLVGREAPAAQHAIKQRIVSIAHRLGLKLPESWQSKDKK